MVEFLFSGKGRIRRRDYALAGLFLIVAPVIFAGLGLACVQVFGERFTVLGPDLQAALHRVVVAGLERFDAPTDERTVTWVKAAVAILPLVGIGTVATVWSFFALTARRLHDVGWSGWLAALVVLPGIGAWMIYLVLILVPGQRGSNRYGAEPRPPPIAA